MGSLFILLTTTSNAQNFPTNNSESQSSKLQTFLQNETEKKEYILSKLIDDLENSVEIELVSVDDLFNLTLRAGHSTNAYSLNVIDNTGKTIIDGKIEPNTSLNFDLTDYPAENYLLRITDMSTLKVTVCKVLPI